MNFFDRFPSDDDKKKRKKKVRLAGCSVNDDGVARDFLLGNIWKILSFFFEEVS